VIKNAFKMACIAYHPKPFNYGGKQFEKGSLLERSLNMIEQSFETFVQNNSKQLGYVQGGQPYSNHPLVCSVQDYLARQFSAATTKTDSVLEVPAASVQLKQELSMRLPAIRHQSQTSLREPVDLQRLSTSNLKQRQISFFDQLERETTVP